MASSISGLREKQQRELENLTVATQPVKTLKYFVLSIVQCLRGFIAKCGWVLLLVITASILGCFAMTVGGPHEQELFNYLRFGLWWLALGVASSIGLGSGLHTFVLYLGPHIALFTIKTMQCGRVDIKSAPYDTIQLKSGPSWVDRDCSEFGPPLFPSQVPISSILPQVQLEAILWGIGTALGELPPYFISRAGVVLIDASTVAHISGNKLEAVKELDSSPAEASGIVANHLHQIKLWLLSHSQYLNFISILVLASVPNPLFDLAGIMCGQFGISFWKFFLATLIGKAFIKTHIQTVFIISVCNNQLLDLIENKLIWLLSQFPVLGPLIPNLSGKLHTVKEKYMHASHQVPSNTKVKRWNLSFASIWNTVVWLVLVNFFIKIVTATAQSFLKEEHERELSKLTEKLRASEPSKYECSQASD